MYTLCLTAFLLWTVESAELRGAFGDDPFFEPIATKTNIREDVNGAAIEVQIDNRKATQTIECDVPCKSSTGGGVVRTLTFRDTPWTMVQSMEGPQYYRRLRPDNTPNKFWSTTSMKSAVPMPYFSWAEYNIQNPAVDFDRTIKGASFIAHNCNSKNGREDFVRGMISGGFQVDSLSSCLHNAESRVGKSNKESMMRQYLFHLALENQCEEDYVTEKLWGALASGTVPVYYGAPNINEHVPAMSTILADDFESHAVLGDYLTMLSLNKTAYGEYHVWRTKPLPQWFIDKYRFTHTHSACRVCRWAWAKMHGLRWNHTNQEVIYR